MKQYLLFAFGDFTSDVTVENMVESVAAITHSDYTKFKQNTNYIIFNFETQLNYNSLVNHINATITNVTQCHFLMEVTDNSTIYMDNVDLECFLTLNNINDKQKNTNKPKNGDNKTMLMDETFFQRLFGIDLSFTADSFNEMNDMEDMDDLDDMGEYEKLKLKSKPKLELDAVLEKISKSGVESLTKEEKNYLKTY
jgi:hypothetical protein